MSVQNKILFDETISRDLLSTAVAEVFLSFFKVLVVV
jgi:hypothetical protein